ncbi:S41 family peptidase [Vallitalea sp.]|jgi:carboxyl-terminal processing protease|uniref:S41 family peptidase n=1 Tax=Vallitalea sp. TaxID=1882829 RepID=UPI0025F01A72|nr:S41 family peptidase [Vallitalea sp.]MCT4688666.1 S41 family peptidase [Vallitalea sp.]
MKNIISKMMVIGLVLAMLIVPVNADSVASKNIELRGEQFKALFKLIRDNYVGEEVTDEKLFKAAIDGMFDELDPYSTFYTKKEANTLIESVSGEFVGIGAVMVQDGDWVKVLYPIPKSPAIRAGVKAEDLVIAINGKSAKNLTPTEAANKIKGKEGTKVSITFRRGEMEYTVDIKRALVKISAVETEEIKDLFPKLDKEIAKKINYIRINSINKNVAEDIEPYIEDAKKQGVKYLILDLRDNLGGYVDSGVALCNMLIPKGPVLHFVNKEGRKITYRSNLRKAPFELVVLTNENTASASEFIAAAVKESGVGVTVGETTYGKGVAQYIYDISDKYSIKLTMEEFLSRDGNKINGIGVAPDYEVIVPNLIVSPQRLFLNDEMEEVKSVELILEYLGYAINEPDNLYDKKTEKAVTEFQKKMRLRVYGVSDHPTLKALNTKLTESIKEKDIQLEKALHVILSKINEN